MNFLLGVPTQIKIKSDDSTAFFMLFVKNNLPAIFYFSGVHEDYHEPTDTADKILYNIYNKRVKLIFHTAWSLANSNEKIKLN